MSMWQTASAPVRSDIVVIHDVVDHRGRRRFLATMAGRALCLSRNPLPCAARALLAEGRDPAVPIVFRDASNGLEEVMTIAEAAEERLPGLGEVVAFGKAVRS